jgi:hypothetical protein
MGFLPIEADPCVFLRQQDGSLILAYVDDIMFITRSSAGMSNIKEQFFGKYKCRDLGPISQYQASVFGAIALLALSSSLWNHTSTS